MDISTILLIVAGIIFLIWLWGLIKRVGGLLLHLLVGIALLYVVYYVLSGQSPLL